MPTWEKYHQNAKKSLSEARGLCEDAYRQLHATRLRFQSVKKRQSNWNFITTCLERQCRFLLDQILPQGVGNTLKLQRTDVAALNQVMVQWQSQIDKQLTTMANIPNKLVRDEYCLRDYITMNDVNLLNDRLDEIPLVETHLKNIALQYHEMCQKVESDLINIQLHKVKEVNTSLNDHILHNLEDFPLRLNEFEDEMVEILQSMTQHFDKTSILVNWDYQLGNPDKLFEVVQKDDQELPTIRNSLFNLFDDIDKLIFEFKEQLDKFGELDMQSKQVSDSILQDLDKYDEYLQIFKDINDLISKFSVTCQDDLKTIQDLSNFYTNFQDSYSQLLLEKERRAELSIKMERILQNCALELNKLNEIDMLEREKFLNEHGDYLPDDIWPQEISDMSSMYDLKYWVKKY